MLYWTDISLTGAGITTRAANGLFVTHESDPKKFHHCLPQYWYFVRSSSEPSRTRATYAGPPRPDGVPNE
ncbi:Uncharacterised protein [Mycobacterium tuberculosis]|nr:Uncharacterised protein [Mycobacterium tuberculosis]